MEVDWNVAEWTTAHIARINDVAGVAVTLRNEACSGERREHFRIGIWVLAFNGVANSAEFPELWIHSTMAEVAVDAVQIIVGKFCGCSRGASFTEPCAGRVASNAEFAGEVGVLVGYGERGMPDRIAGRLRHHAGDPRIKRRKGWAVVGVAEGAIVAGNDRGELIGVRVRLGSGLTEILGGRWDLCLHWRAAHECAHRAHHTSSEHRAHANNQSDSCAWLALKGGCHLHLSSIEKVWGLGSACRRRSMLISPSVRSIVGRRIV